MTRFSLHQTSFQISVWDEFNTLVWTGGNNSMSCGLRCAERRVARERGRKGERGNTFWPLTSPLSSHSLCLEANQSLSVPYAGPALAPGAFYNWSVTVWTNSPSAPTPCQVKKNDSAYRLALYESAHSPFSLFSPFQSAPSAQATFVTALFKGFDSGAQWIGAGATSATFNLVGTLN